jgi:hypothetical protein
VPTSGFTGAETAAALIERLEAGFARLGAAGVPRETLLRQGIVTPSCGLGSLPPAQAEAALGLALEISARLQRRRRA